MRLPTNGNLKFSRCTDVCVSKLLMLGRQNCIIEPQPSNAWRLSLQAHVGYRKQPTDEQQFDIRWQVLFVALLSGRQTYT